MGNFEKFYKAEDFIKNMIKKELVGPIRDNETLDSTPLNAYVAGILWPKPLRRNANRVPSDEEREFEIQSKVLQDEQVLEAEDQSAVPDEIVLEEFKGDVVKDSSMRKPSTMGISVIAGKEVGKVKVNFSFGKYVHSEELREYGKEGKSRVFHLYTRQGYSIDLTFDLSKEDVEYVAIDNDKLSKFNIIIKATKRTGKAGEPRLITFSVTNDQEAQAKDIVQNENALFQCKLDITACEGEFLPLDPGETPIYDLEDEILAMQYRKVYNYAQGHGCAAAFDEKDGKCRHVWSEFVPEYEVKQMKSAEVEDKELFSLKYLYTADRNSIVSRLNKFVDLYKEWAKEQKNSSNASDYDRYRHAVKDCLEKISICTDRIESGIRCLKENDNAWKAFVLANKAMYKQRISIALMNKKINSESEFETKMSNPVWYPFQLFYLLMIIPDFTSSNSQFKDVVDLLWFPTGGGKTEAYLAVSAFIIFYERLSENKRFYGTSVIMRYTLRLLTIQQFERASALICACESVKIEEKVPGGEISIGLWIGGDSAPNTIDEAKKAIKTLRDGEPLYELANPIQITKCPYCGKELNALNYDIENGEMKIVCNKCGKLPIYIVDSDIYKQVPTLIMSTVDKFARIVWDERTGRIFGCNIDSSKPRLIIQDELHLISGPLGTLTGLYETAIDRLCWTTEGAKPKIIASTATVKNAAYQIKGLYNRKHFQFPPNGLDYTDSFFAIQARKEDKPSRYYVGLSEQGGSMVDLMIRVFSVLCLSDLYLEKSGNVEEVIDQYYTIIGYFNAIKDLGTSSTILRERMFNYVNSLINGKFSDLSEKIKLEKTDNGNYKGDIKFKTAELTSRKTSYEIRNILDDLRIPFKLNDEVMAYKYVLSSSMFSVGIDIDRLGVMVMNGQPKSNADYIQATSRVGRTNPGLVFCLYNAFRSRDRSYYERFNQYHSCFYKYVESTSVTPFSMRSIEKGLHAIFIALVRHLVPGMSANDSANKFNKNSEQVSNIRKYIIDRIYSVQPSAKEGATAYLDEFIDMWHNSGSSLVYDARKKGQDANKYRSLLISSEESQGPFTILNSVRNVEKNANVFVEEGGK